MMKLLGFFLLLCILGGLADSTLFRRGYQYDGYGVYQSDRSSTGYAINRRYYDMETGDTYVASQPVQLVAYSTHRPARGVVSNVYTTEYGVYPRSN